MGTARPAAGHGDAPLIANASNSSGITTPPRARRLWTCLRNNASLGTASQGGRPHVSCHRSIGNTLVARLQLCKPAAYTTSMMTIAPPTTAPLRIGVCGSGITVVHIAGYQKIPGVEVVAIDGTDVERCQAVAAEDGLYQEFVEYRDLLALGL